MNIVYNKKNFNIFKVGKNSFIVYNAHKKFEEGHSHISNYKTAKYIIDLAYHRTVPRHLSPYLLRSLIRISEHKTYIDQIKNLLP